MGSEDLVAQGDCGCPHLGSFQSQVEQPGPVGDVHMAGSWDIQLGLDDI